MPPIPAAAGRSSVTRPSVKADDPARDTHCGRGPFSLAAYRLSTPCGERNPDVGMRATDMASFPPSLAAHGVATKISSRVFCAVRWVPVCPCRSLRPLLNKGGTQLQMVHHPREHRGGVNHHCARSCYLRRFWIRHPSLSPSGCGSSPQRPECRRFPPPLEGARRSGLRSERLNAMPNAVYPLLLLMVVYVLGAAFFKSELFGHALLLAFAMALMLVINHYSELYVWGLAYQARSPWLRSFLANSAITVASIAPAVILGLVWVVRERVQSFALYAVAIATATSGLATAYGEIARLAPYYPRFSLVTLLGSADQFAVVGAVVPVALSIAALRKARLPLTIPQPVRRAASALHGESDWLPIAAAKLWFNKGDHRRGLPPRPQ